MYSWQEMLWHSSDDNSEVVHALLNETICPDLKRLEQALTDSGCDVEAVVKRYTLDDRLQTHLRWRCGNARYRICLHHQEDLCFLLETELSGDGDSTESSCCLTFIQPGDSGEHFLSEWRDTLARVFSELTASRPLAVA
ncbi:hypothetical protein [Oceanospirillum sediminis]|uniref:Uncharacterized protein n=1 Tax=Oceanospirillum sediminis TaxID=2760088 RepID=A0A839IV71_9GAMM|nr:hypothetical protein [Oceanospirillum sediminis]MBB1488016.1 hypothetical protein [Oceanospirillum sediminis]